MQLHFIYINWYIWYVYIQIHICIYTYIKYIIHRVHTKKVHIKVHTNWNITLKWVRKDKKILQEEWGGFIWNWFFIEDSNIMTLKRSSTHFYKRTPTILPVLHVLWEHLNSIVGAMSSNYEYKISHNSEAIFQMFHISYFTFSHLNQ